MGCYIRNRKGSTLLMVVIMVAVLTVLGTALLSITFMNFNMKQTDNRLKKSFYYSESGIEQVYANAGVIVDKALVYAAGKTAPEIETIKTTMETYKSAVMSELYTIESTSSLRSLLDADASLSIYSSDSSRLRKLLHSTDSLHFTNNNRSADPLHPTYESYYLKVINTSNSDYAIVIDEDKLQAEADRLYRSYFREYMNTQTSTSIIVAGLSNRDQLTDDLIGPTNVKKIDTTVPDSILTMSIVEYKPFDNIDNSPNNQFVIRGVQSTFDYILNSKNMGRRTLKTDIVITEPRDSYPLIINQNRLVIEDNPIWQCGLLSHSDIKFENSSSTINGRVYGYGTELLDNKNAVVYSGGIDVSGNSNVTINNDIITHSYVQLKNNSPQLTINNAHVYCDSFVVQSDTSNANANMNNVNLYTRDDIEVNGNSAYFRLQGSYYGFSDGTDAQAGRHDLSSAIIINGLNYRNFEITGDATTIPYNETASGILIGGTAYVNAEGDAANWPYQTAESVAMRGNYLAYAWENPSSAAIFTTATSPAGLSLVLGDITAKKNYFMDFYRIVDQSGINGILNLGNANYKVDMNKYLFSQGVKIGSIASVNIPDSTTYASMSVDEFSTTLKPTIPADYAYSINRIKNREDDTSIGSMSKDISYDVNDSNMVMNYFTTVPATYRIQTTKEVTAASGSGTATEIAYINDATNENVALLGTGSGYNFLDGSVHSIGGINYTIYNVKSNSGNKMQGIVYCSGKVLVEGTLDFTGSIMAKGDIDIKGNLTINNMGTSTYNYIVTYIIDHYEMRQLFAKSVAEVKTTELSSAINVSSGAIGTMQQRYNQMLHLSKWQIIE